MWICELFEISEERNMFRSTTCIWNLLALISLTMAADIVEEMANEVIEEAEPMFSTLDYVVLGLLGKYLLFFKAFFRKWKMYVICNLEFLRNNKNYKELCKQWIVLNELVWRQKSAKCWNKKLFLSLKISYGTVYKRT